jgi:hypothetical protein
MFLEFYDTIVQEISSDVQGAKKKATVGPKVKNAEFDCMYN